MATIKDVARQADVAISTVSRVINQTGYVSQETRAKVMRAMRDLHYRPNGIARSLKRKDTHCIGLALNDISNPFFGEVAKAVEVAAREAGYAVLFADKGDHREEEDAVIDLFLEKQVDGIIWFAPTSEEKVREVTQRHKVRIVVITAAPAEYGQNTVRINDARGAFEAVSHLVRLGHRRIGYIAEPDRPASVSQERLRGYRRALEEHGLSYDTSLVVRGTFREGSGAPAVDALMSLQSPPSAIFAANDLMAIEAMNRLRTLGRRVPEDVAVVGFDDVKMAGLTGIDLTTVSQPKQEMGKEAAKLLIESLNGMETVREVVLSPHLVVRKSCGHVRTRGGSS